MLSIAAYMQQDQVFVKISPRIRRSLEFAMPTVKDYSSMFLKRPQCSPIRIAEALARTPSHWLYDDPPFELQARF